jgi:hypothetical protein
MIPGMQAEAAEAIALLVAQTNLALGSMSLGTVSRLS